MTTMLDVELQDYTRRHTRGFSEQYVEGNVLLHTHLTVLMTPFYEHQNYHLFC
jgi:hypothetical protein